MRLLLIALCLYISAMSLMIYNDHRATAKVHEAMTTVGFDYYIEYVSEFDQKKQTSRRREIERWAMQVDPEILDPGPVMAWVNEMQRKWK